jgi:hypothetical protein
MAFPRANKLKSYGLYPFGTNVAGQKVSHFHKSFSQTILPLGDLPS